MTTTEPHAVPVDAVLERLNDPTVAASLVTVLDNAELLSTLVLGLAGFMDRGEMIMDAVAESVGDLKAANADLELPPIGRLGEVARQLGEAGPALEGVLASAMVRPETIELLGMFSEAATEGVAQAKANPGGGGFRDLFRAIRDPEVQRGLDVLVEISRALGRRLG